MAYGDHKFFSMEKNQAANQVTPSGESLPSSDGSRLQRFGVKLVTLASERARVAANQVSSTVFFCIVFFVATSL